LALHHPGESSHCGCRLSRRNHKYLQISLRRISNSVRKRNSTQLLFKLEYNRWRCGKI
jgi:hypothetical protein